MNISSNIIIYTIHKRKEVNKIDCDILNKIYLIHNSECLICTEKKAFQGTYLGLQNFG